MTVARRKPTYSVSVRRLDLTRLGACLRELENAGVNELKVDFCDGTFAPGFALGFEVVEAICRATRLPVHVHLLVERPERYLAEVAQLGCKGIAVPAEACTHTHRTLAQIRELGMKAGVSLHPGTALTRLEYVLPLIDRVLLPVYDGPARETGPSGAAFERARILRDNIDYQGTGAALYVEGDLTARDAARFAASGADGIVLDRADILRIEPLDESVRRYCEEVAAAMSTV